MGLAQFSGTDMNGLFIKTWIHKGVVESTNDLARQVVVSGLGDCPVLVSAERQTRGRGRGDHTWWSDRGSLTFTIGIDPIAHGLRTEHEPRVALATAVAVIDAIAQWIPRESIRLRWPNDIEVESLKIAGILPERVGTPHGVRLLIGIGINVSTRLDDAPAEIRRMATSLAQHASRFSTASDHERVLARVVAHFETAIGRLAEDDLGLAARWDQLDALRDRPVRLDVGPQILEGIGRGIDPSGALRLATDQGIKLLYGGQVLRDNPS
ncbi:biotin--[acetyl-CoA-carboxylase] ligase [Singulisphaera sp. Ch08]|uniref:biotin--[biotin carboxyl-carrier protein] ligase n=1 Tax=Singulisphaera sp. Ch08 TaxID=3120278 RepID=A0AAU7CQD6_9BACT